MKSKTIILTLLCVFGFWYAASAQLRDIEGKRYKTVKIGEQEWMAENLNVALFRNGDTIPEAQTKEEWLAAARNKQPAWCYYRNDKRNGKTYGKLYNWYAVNDPRGLAPEGWKVPNKEEWLKMLFYISDPATAGKQLKSKKLWKDPFKRENKGNNKTRFNALPAGWRTQNAAFFEIGSYTFFWTSTEAEHNKEYAIYRTLSYHSQAAIENSIEKSRGFSVRCIKE